MLRPHLASTRRVDERRRRSEERGGGKRNKCHDCCSPHPGANCWFNIREDRSQGEMECVCEEEEERVSWRLKGEGEQQRVGRNSDSST